MRFIILLFLALTLALCQTALAQDKLLLRNGEEMLVRVLEISPDSVHFSAAADSASKELASLPKSSLFSITYQNGKVDVIAEKILAKQQILSDEQLYERGRLDAQKNHKAIGAFVGTAGATIVTGIPLGLPAGLATGAVLGYTKVPEKRIKPSKRELLDYPSYRQGYIKQAEKKKRTNAAAGFATGMGLWVTVFVALVISFNRM